MAESHKTPSDKYVVVGQFAGPHGVRGAFKVRSFTEDPAAITTYGPLTTKDGKTLTLKVDREMKPALFLVTAPEVKSREDCDLFKGALLTVSRDALPDTEEDEYYLDDLIGLSAVTLDGQEAGKVKAVVNYGAGDILELFQVPDRKGTILIPFTKEAVPHVDMKASQVVVELPEEDDEDPASEDEEKGGL